MGTLRILALLGCAHFAIAQTGQLTVTVKDPSGKVLPSARVSISSRPTYQPVSAAAAKPVHYNASSVATSSGIASFSEVPAGAYAICAAAPTGNLIDTCTFSEHPPSTIVIASKTVSATVSLTQGIPLQVVVNDVNQLLVAPSALTATSRQLRLSVAVPKGPWRPLSITSLAAVARQYSVLVPVGTPLVLRIGNSGYKLSDSFGAPIVNKGSLTAINFQAAATETAHTIQLNVAGTI